MRVGHRGGQMKGEQKAVERRGRGGRKRMSGGAERTDDERKRFVDEARNGGAA